MDNDRNDNVVSLRYLTSGEETFMLCHCEDGGILVTPVVLIDPKKGPIIVSVVCPECESSSPVNNGIVDGSLEDSSNEDD